MVGIYLFGTLKIIVGILLVFTVKEIIRILLFGICVGNGKMLR